MSAERGETEYDKKYTESEAIEVIKRIAEYIREYSAYFGVDPNIVAGVIFVEQFYNYDLVDIATDWFAFYGIDMSVGVGQVRMSTAKYLEEQGYVPATSAEEGGWDIPVIGFIYGTETMARYQRLLNDASNVFYVAAYIKCLEDLWVEEYPEISTSSDILGSLYNLGHEKVPHDDPRPNWFGEAVEFFYDLMEETLNNE